MSDMTGIIGTTTGTLALLWHILTWFHDRRRHVTVQSARDAWYAVSQDPEPRLIVHCVARFRNRSPLAGSIVHCDVALSHTGGPLRDWRIDCDLKQVVFRPDDRDVSMVIPLPSDAGTERLRSNEDPVLVDPSAPVDRDICAVFQGNIPPDLSPTRLTITSCDDRGHRSSTSVDIGPAEKHPQAQESYRSVAGVSARQLPRQW